MIGTRIGLAVGIRGGLAVGIGADPEGPGGFFATLLTSVIGDSNTVGIGTGDAADTGFNVKTPVPAVPYNAHYANGTGPPPTFVEYPGDGVFGPLSLYAASGGQSMGMEMSLGPEMVNATANPAIAKVGVSGSTLATEWLPTSTYPAAGAGNLFNLWVARMHAAEAACGKKLVAVFVHLGTNDALNAGQAAATQANIGAFCTAARSAFGAGLVIVWVKTNLASTPTNVAAVRSGQVAYAGTDPLFALIENDDLPIKGDGLHFQEGSYLELGQRCAYAALDLLGFARKNISTTPAVVGYGTEVHGAANLVVPSWGGERDGDLQLMHVTCGIVTGSIATPSGWTLVNASGDATGGGVHENSSVFSRKVTTALLGANSGHMPSTTVTITTATRNAAKVYTVRGPAALDVTNVDQSAGTAAAVFNSGPFAITGVTTTAANELVCIFTGGYCGSSPANPMAVTAAGLANVVEVQDSVAVIVTDRQVLTLTTGQLAAAGATGSPSATSGANMVMVGHVVSIKP